MYCELSDDVCSQLLQVTLAHPDCSALQSVCLRILRAALCTPALCDNLLRKPDGDCEDVPLQASLAQVCPLRCLFSKMQCCMTRFCTKCQVVSSATDVPIAKRSPVIGFALAASKMLRDWCQGNSEGATCKLWDKGDEPWLCAGRPRCKASYLQVRTLGCKLANCSYHMVLTYRCCFAADR